MSLRTLLIIFSCLYLLLGGETTWQIQAQRVSGHIILNRGARITNNPEKEVSITIQVRGAREMMISNNSSFVGARWRVYEPYISKWKLAGEDGRKTVYAQFKSPSGDLSDAVSAEIELDRTPPLNPSIVVNDGREYTNDQYRRVRLDISATEAFQMRVSNRRDFLRAPWVPYKKRMASWNLTAMPGRKKVYVQFKDRAGNTTPVVYDEIYFDNLAPERCSMEIEQGSIYTKNQKVRIHMRANGASEMIFRGGDGWVPYQEYIDFELSPGDGEKEVVAKFRDEAGNQSTVVHDKILLDTQGPVNGKIIINDRMPYTKEPTNLHLKFFVMGASHMMVSNDSSFAGKHWMPYSPVINSWTVTPENGKKTVYVKFKDKAGNESETYSDDIELDDTPPYNGYIEIMAKDAVYDSLAKVRVVKNEAHVVDLKIKAEDASYMMLSNTSTFYAAAWKPYKDTVTNWALSGDEDGSRYIFVRFRDKAGNVSQPVSDQVIVDTEPPIDCRVHIEGTDREDLFTIDSARVVELKLFARHVHEMMISNDSLFTNGKWEPYETIKHWQLSPEDGAKHVYVKFRDLVGNESKTISDDIFLDRKPPTKCSVLLNKGETATNNIDKVVLLKVNAEECVTMQVSNEPDFAGKRWIGYTALNINWQLAGDDGMKSVYVRFKDEAGNISKAYADSIMLDRTPPKKGTVTINGGEQITNNSNKKVTLTLHAEEVTEMRLANVYTFADSEWEAYAETKEWMLTGPDGMKTVFVQFRDSLGNTSKVAVDRIGIDREAPVGGSITIDNGATYCTDIDKRVNLRLRVREANFMKVSNNADFSDTDWQNYTPFIQNWTLDGDDGNKTVYVSYKDLAGNETKAEASILLDRQEPVNESIEVNDGAEYTNNKQQIVTLKLTAEGATEMMIGDDKFFRYPAKWEPYNQSVSWTLKGRDGKKTLYVKFRDEAGNESTIASADIRLDTEPPTPRFVKINGSKTGTESRMVELGIKAKGAKFMMVAEDPKFQGAEWEVYREKRQLTLSAGAGLKRVFVKFKDDAENVSGHVFGDITLFESE